MEICDFIRVPRHTTDEKVQSLLRALGLSVNATIEEVEADALRLLQRGDLASAASLVFFKDISEEDIAADADLSMVRDGLQTADIASAETATEPLDVANVSLGYLVMLHAVAVTNDQLLGQ